MASRNEPPKRRMTKAQLDALDERVFSFIRSYQLKEGISPSREEIFSSLKLSGIMTAQRSVERLKRKKKIRFTKNSKRGIESPELEAESSSLIHLPLLGTVAAGSPIEAIEQAESIQVPRNLVRGMVPHFVLRVRGDSMIEDHICDGDFVVIRQQLTANNGDRVVALINNKATLKRFNRKMGQIQLHPANPNHSPIIVESHHHFRIAGIYVGLVRILT